MSDPARLVVIPTALERSDGFLDLAALAGVGLADWELLLHGVPWWLLVVPTLVVALWTLTGEAAADVQYLGAIASGLRSKLGLRRAHEWVFAWWHYFGLRTWPDFKEWANAKRSRDYRYGRETIRALASHSAGRIAAAQSWLSLVVRVRVWNRKGDLWLPNAHGAIPQLWVFHSRADQRNTPRAEISQLARSDTPALRTTGDH